MRLIRDKESPGTLVFNGGALDALNGPGVAPGNGNFSKAREPGFVLLIALHVRVHNVRLVITNP